MPYKDPRKYMECVRRYQTSPEGRANYKRYRSSIAGRTKMMWSNICNRVSNCNGRNPSYAHVELRMTKNEFVRWAVPALTRWMNKNPGLRPSVDIRDGGHYEVINLRILELGENARLQSRNRNVYAPVGMAWCARHKEYLSVACFGKRKNAMNGLMSSCRECQRRYMREYKASRKKE
jgi:hypothetical protein